MIDTHLMRSRVTKAVEIVDEDGIVHLARCALSWPRRRQLRIAKRQVHQKFCSGYDAVANPLKIVWIDPSRVQHFGRPARIWDSIATIKGGSWDRDTSAIHFSWGRERSEWISRDFNQLPKPKAIRKRYVDGHDWEDTGIYEFYMYNIKRRGEIDGCTQREDIGDRLRSVDKLYESLKKDGYDETYHETTSPQWWRKSHCSHTVLDFPRINVGRDGEFLFAGAGWHRMTIAQILEINKIPCWIVCRHTEWQQTREAVAADSGRPCDSTIRSHPDLRDIV